MNNCRTRNKRTFVVLLFLLLNLAKLFCRPFKLCKGTACTFGNSVVSIFSDMYVLSPKVHAEPKWPEPIVVLATDMSAATMVILMHIGA